MGKDESKELLELLINAVLSDDKKSVEKYKYKNLLYGSNLLDVVINYHTLCKFGIKFDFKYHLLRKGTKLYRIRKYDDNIDFSHLKQWSYPPSMPMNRANLQGEPALYLGTTENVCLLETHIKNDEKYVLGEYEVTEDIKLGGFFDCEDIKTGSPFFAGVILNAYLIAPSRNDKNKELFSFLDNYYKNYSINQLTINEAKSLDLPLKFAVLNKCDKYYVTTNMLLEDIKRTYSDGIGFSSCYIPVSTIGILCSDYNVVLYTSGMKKIKFLKHCIKVKENNINDLDVIKILISDSNKKEN